MDGYLAPLPEICDLAERYDALVMVDDSHAVGFMGANGRGTHEHLGVMGRVDVISGTLGKALGGASGGYVSGRKELVAMLRQRSRPYLFSNSVAPSDRGREPQGARADPVGRRAAAAAARQHGVLPRRDDRGRLRHPAGRASDRPGDGRRRQARRRGWRELMLERGIYVVSFSYPVVPQGKARIRTQVSAAHSKSRSRDAPSRPSSRREWRSVGRASTPRVLGT